MANPEPRRRKPKVRIDPAKRIRPRDLRRMERFLDNLPAPMNRIEAIYRVSASILQELLGEEWSEYHVFYKGLGLQGYLGGGDLDTHVLRVYTLADLLLNLQDVKGFTGVLSRVAGGDLEPSFAELEVGKLLAWTNVQF